MFALESLKVKLKDKALELGFDDLRICSAEDFGEDESALAMMKEYYGGMLSVGATTFWEDFDLEWLEGSGRLDEMPKEGVKDIHGDFGKFCYGSFRHSFCHGWSAGVVTFIEEEC